MLINLEGLTVGAPYALTILTETKPLQGASPTLSVEWWGAGSGTGGMSPPIPAKPQQVLAIPITPVVSVLWVQVTSSDLREWTFYKAVMYAK